MDAVARDLRQAVRSLARAPGFTLTTVLTLALAIGATTAVFSVVEAVLLQPLPYAETARLVSPAMLARAQPGQVARASLADFADWRARATSFSHIAAYLPGTANVAGGTGAQRVSSAAVAGGLLATLGVRPALGRDFRPDEERPGAPLVTILSHALWQQQYGGDPDIVGRQVLRNGESYTVVGVLPSDFIFPDATMPDVQILRPLVFDDARELRRDRFRYLPLTARLAPGVTRAAAAAELNAIQVGIDEATPRLAARDLAAVVPPLHAQLVGDLRGALLILFGAVVGVLAIACLNVATLMLVRGVVRQREIATRAALGASRGRVFRELLTESALVAAGGGMAGLGVSALLVQGLNAMRPAALASWELDAVSVPVLAFALVTSACTTLLCGVAPAVAASRTDLTRALRLGPASASTSRARRRFLDTLVAGQLAVVLVLLIGAGLMVQSFRQLRFEQLGFEPDEVVAVDVRLDLARYPDVAQQQAFFTELLSRAATMPAVRTAAVSLGLPPSSAVICHSLLVDGGAPDPDAPCVLHQLVSPAYFETMRIPLLAGRSFTDREMPFEDVAIVNAAFARTHFGDDDPIGRVLRPVAVDELAPWTRRTVVGVVGDAKNRGLSVDPEPQVYLPFEREPASFASLLLRGPDRLSAVATPLREMVREIDPAQAMGAVGWLDARLARETTRESFLASVLSAFAMAALILAVVGVYGLTAYTVGQRRHEFGVRLALGARPGQVLRSVLARATRLVAVSALVGVAGALVATRWLERYLFEIGATDVTTFVLAGLVLGGGALVASYRPARAASRTDPASALRCD